jgi:hypothetical protein
MKIKSQTEGHFYGSACSGSRRPRLKKQFTSL